ncbi:hypothetical protein DPMN_121360 [Dreissena polymorpha]|uniref:Uncharacterized protein n=1 Tax=Dreissena polymorpha TaxID=45954 RepID=A0A9D4JPF8_DREPO|nr:hypothetical protein DPMN_121360 [Dreissena polymorpha]
MQSVQERRHLQQPTEQGGGEPTVTKNGATCNNLQNKEPTVTKNGATCNNLQNKEPTVTKNGATCNNLQNKEPTVTKNGATCNNLQNKFELGSKMSKANILARLFSEKTRGIVIASSSSAVSRPPSAKLRYYGRKVFKQTKEWIINLQTDGRMFESTDGGDGKLISGIVDKPTDGRLEAEERLNLQMEGWVNIQTDVYVNVCSKRVCESPDGNDIQTGGFVILQMNGCVKIRAKWCANLRTNGY